ncbi:MAG: murein biosynthesis integral membrane protein MurJ [Rhodospirillales bacterium]|nr:murein biosynthesis integral membrane protein MurJ [Rhodospirillales bacterium]MCW8862830.1 murein biosynthesis integral membrane protein MurJ [Rhodospirillales bacterium]MCW9003390.1 murein biosynthesis integral membrane protein MurJ [Rhodospirillales bacterium]
MTLLRSIATVGGYTMASRVLGFVRDILVAAVLGAGPVADAFFVAFKFPNLFRRLFAEGAFNAAFVPLFAGQLESGGRDVARAFAGQALSVLMWILMIFAIVMELSMPWAMMAFAPGFMDDPQRFDLAVQLTRITFPYLLLISVVSLLAGVLNSLGRFAAAAATPILLNICLIGAVLGFAQVAETPGHALAWGVFTAGIAQVAWLGWHCAREGMWPGLPRPRLTADVRTLIRRIVPGAIGAGVYQVNLLIDTIIASFLPAGSISFLFYADRVNQLPLGVVGVAVGTALLPLLSRQLRAGEDVAAMHSQNRALEFALLITVPAAIALTLIADPVITVLFQRGAFDAAAAAATAGALSIYALGLPAYVLVKALTPGFFARGDTVTPVKVAAVCMMANLVLNLILMGPFLHLGIAMATVVSAWMNVILLSFVLRRRGFLTIDARLAGRLPRILVASAVMGGGLWFGADALSVHLAAAPAIRIAALVGLVVGGLAVFAVSAHLTGAARVGELRSMMRKPLPPPAPPSGDA